MPHYYVHLCEHQRPVFDDEGLDLADDEAAIAYAIQCIRDVASNSILEGEPIRLSNYMVICGADGTDLYRLHFSDVIEFMVDAVLPSPPPVMHLEKYRRQSAR